MSSPGLAPRGCREEKSGGSQGGSPETASTSRLSQGERTSKAGFWSRRTAAAQVGPNPGYSRKDLGPTTLRVEAAMKTRSAEDEHDDFEFEMSQMQAMEAMQKGEGAQAARAVTQARYGKLPSTRAFLSTHTLNHPLPHPSPPSRGDGVVSHRLLAA
jgi:hypothetical protein